MPSVARWNDSGVLDHENHRSFGGARAVHHRLRNHEALSRSEFNAAGKVDWKLSSGPHFVTLERVMSNAGICRIGCSGNVITAFSVIFVRQNQIGYASTNRTRLLTSVNIARLRAA